MEDDRGTLDLPTAGAGGGSKAFKPEDGEDTEGRGYYWRMVNDRRLPFYEGHEYDRGQLETFGDSDKQDFTELPKDLELGDTAGLPDKERSEKLRQWWFGHYYRRIINVLDQIGHGKEAEQLIRDNADKIAEAVAGRFTSGSSYWDHERQVHVDNWIREEPEKFLRVLPRGILLKYSRAIGMDPSKNEPAEYHNELLPLFKRDLKRLEAVLPEFKGTWERLEKLRELSNIEINRVYDKIVENATYIVRGTDTAELRKMKRNRNIINTKGKMMDPEKFGDFSSWTISEEAACEFTESNQKNHGDDASIILKLPKDNVRDGLVRQGYRAYGDEPENSIRIDQPQGAQDLDQQEVRLPNGYDLKEKGLEIIVIDCYYEAKRRNMGEVEYRTWFEKQYGKLGKITWRIKERQARPTT
ncbi:MAG: hypothetical protein MPJ06_03530 [Nitrosopumilus sp.]|nr:hypothetical protein [Nitrosopumilus sp.]MDA7943062.1 hypothetical protein [Nitrosopumilus sp.]